MTNQNHETIDQQIYEAFEKLTPDEVARNRMYANMMRRAASPPAKKKLWYQHWQLSAGVCTAALACVVVATASIHARMPEGGTEGLQVVPPAATTNQTSDADTPVQTVSTESSLSASESIHATIATAHQTETQTKANASSGVAVVGDTWEETPSSEAETAATGTAGTAALPVQTKPAQETVPAIVTTVSAVQTTARPHTTMVPETSTEAETESDDIVNVPIRQNIYLYYRLIWGGCHYNTQYERLSSSMLGDYLGYSVTNGADVEDTYTVLIYEIEGVDSTQQLAVQYAGEDAYYLFTVG